MFSKFLRVSLAAAGMIAAVPAANAYVVISEVDASGSSSGNGYAVDWFELTNTGTEAFDLTNWRVDDGDPSAGTFALSNLTRLAAGESAIVFMETNSGNFATRKTNFLNTWFGPSAPSSLQFGYVDGSNLGLSTSGDGVKLFTAAGVGYSEVSFGASDANATFDNALQYSGALEVKSVAGVNGAFASFSAANTEVGSPGFAPTAVPLPAAAWLLLSGLGALGEGGRRRKASQIPA